MLESIEQFLRDNNYLSVNTKSAYRTALIHFDGFCNKGIKEIIEEDISNWIKQMTEEKVAESTIQQRLTAVRVFFQYWFEEELFKVSPCEGVKRKRKKSEPPESMTRREVILLKEASIKNLTHRIAIDILLHCGLRVSELINLKKSDLFLERGLIRVSNTKNKEDRFATINPELKERIKKYLLMRTDSSDYLIVHSKGKSYTRQGIWKMIKMYQKEMGMTKSIYPHLCRHTFGFMLGEREADIYYIQKKLGQKSLQMARHYSKASGKFLKMKYDEFI